MKAGSFICFVHCFNTVFMVLALLSSEEVVATASSRRFKLHKDDGGCSQRPTIWGRKSSSKCNIDDTIGDLKKLTVAQTGSLWNKIVLKSGTWFLRTTFFWDEPGALLPTEHNPPCLPQPAPCCPLSSYPYLPHWYGWLFLKSHVNKNLEAEKKTVFRF